MKKEAFVALVVWGGMLTTGTFFSENHIKNTTNVVLSNNLPSLSTQGMQNAVGIQNSSCIAIAQDGTKIAYAKGNIVKIENLTDQKQETLFFPNSIQYLKWIEGRSLFIVTQTNTTLFLYRFDLANGKKHLLQQFTKSNPKTQIRFIGFSVYTNDTYLVVGNGNTNAAYRFDTNGNFFNVSYSTSPAKIMVGETNITTYIQTTGNTLFSENEMNNQTTSIATNAHLINQVKNSIYYQKGRRIYQYAQNQPQEIAALPLKVQIAWVNNQGVVYAVGNHTLYNLTAQKAWKIPVKMKVQKVTGGLIFLKKNAFQIIAY